MPDATHQLRVAAIQESSFDVFLSAMMFIGQHGDVVKQIETVTNAANYVFKLITQVISMKKHTQGKPYTFQLRDRNNLTIINAEKLEMNFHPEAFDIFKESLIDADLNKIVNPLRKNRIESAEIKVEDEIGTQATITSSEREYFRPSTSSTHAERELIGKLVSLNKENNSGTFKFGNNSSVRYRYTGENKEQFHKDFALKGPVKAVAVVDFDANLVPVFIEIKSIKTLQAELKLTE
jgi:hypothetical protein